jgi:hypothetical protein
VAGQPPQQHRSIISITAVWAILVLYPPPTIFCFCIFLFASYVLLLQYHLISIIWHPPADMVRRSCPSRGHAITEKSSSERERKLTEYTEFQGASPLGVRSFETPSRPSSQLPLPAIHDCHQQRGR